MALQLKLDVVKAGVLAWNRSAVSIPEALLADVHALTCGTVVEAECAWGAKGLELLKLANVVASGESWEERLAIAVGRANWESVLELVDAQPGSVLTAGWRVRALLNLGRESEFEEALAALISRERIDLSAAPTGLWTIRRDITPEHWLRIPRRLRASTFGLAWRGLLAANDLSQQPFAQTLHPTFQSLLEAVEPSARPQVYAGGPRLERGPDLIDVIAWLAACLGRFASASERAPLEPLFELLARDRPSDRERLRAFRRRAGAEPTVTNAVSHAVAALTNTRPGPAIDRALNAFGLVLGRSPAQQVKAFLAEFDQYLLVSESRALVPRSSAALRSRITSVRYRGSVELRIAELDAIIGQAGEGWFALRRHERRWLCSEGSREDVLAAIPDALFEEAVTQVMTSA
ncbi:MAG: hypothetical protein Q8N23_15550 [Archangium sp.]|nr:hypothetical protein [Archangium sp.]MDP3570007.1 hypothetical protein [Archangium sp.]